MSSIERWGKTKPVSQSKQGARENNSLIAGFIRRSRIKRAVSGKNQEVPYKSMAELEQSRLDRELSALRGEPMGIQSLALGLGSQLGDPYGRICENTNFSMNQIGNRRAGMHPAHGWRGENQQRIGNPTIDPDQEERLFR